MPFWGVIFLKSVCVCVFKKKNLLLLDVPTSSILKFEDSGKTVFIENIFLFASCSWPYNCSEKFIEDFLSPEAI